MTKADLVEQVAEKTGLTRTDVAATVDAFLEHSPTFSNNKLRPCPSH